MCLLIVKSELHLHAKKQFLPIIFYIHIYCIYTLMGSEGPDAKMPP